MPRALLSIPLLSLTLLAAGAVTAAATSLTRIETRPFYGASVTIEEGVRVFRALPPERHVIINPDGKTPLNLTLEERYITVNQHQYIYERASDDGEGGASGYYGATYGTGGYFVNVRKGRRGFHHGKRHRGHVIHVPGGQRGSMGRGGGVR